MFDLNEIFEAVDEIGSKYQTTEEVSSFEEQMEEIRKEVIKEAVERGEYDQEKGQWLI